MKRQKRKKARFKAEEEARKKSWGTKNGNRGKKLVLKAEEEKTQEERGPPNKAKKEDAKRQEAAWKGLRNERICLKGKS